MCVVWDFVKVRRVQKYVETLDRLKIKNTVAEAAPPPPSSEPRQKANQQGGRHSFGDSLIDSPPNTVHQRHSSSGGAAPVVITTQWETFDSIPVSFIPGGGGTAVPSTSQTSFTWDLL